MGFIALFPGHPGVRHDQFSPHDQPVDIKFPRAFGLCLHQSIGGGNRERNREQAVFHRGTPWQDGRDMTNDERFYRASAQEDLAHQAEGVRARTPTFRWTWPSRTPASMGLVHARLA